MNLGQTMITMGMLVLLTMSVISANRMLLENREAMLQAEAYTGSATIAYDLLQEALNKRFDCFSDDVGGQPTTDFSPPDSTKAEWGPSATEKAAVGTAPDDSSHTGTFKSIANFNDVDDYNGYRRVVAANNINGFVVTVRVYYVASNNSTVAVNYRTFYKTVEATVRHPLYLDTTVVYTALASY